MRKVKAVAHVHHDVHGMRYQVDDFFAITSDEYIISLMHYTRDEIAKGIPYKYSSFRDLHKDLLTILKAHNFYVRKWTNFGACWTGIVFIIDDCEYPTHYAI